MTTKKKKSAKEKRVLIIALIVAVAIVAGSTFAWFTSKDEVTNRLSASADYNVSIAEDFQSPSDWLPGQEINKDVSAVNTGSVDAFVRMWLGGAMRLLSEDTTSLTKAEAANIPVTTVGDANKTKLGLTYYTTNTTSGAITYFKTLRTDKINNPNDSAAHSSNPGTGAADADEANNNPAEFSEVQAMQAGGVLVYAPESAEYSWKLEQASTLKVQDSTASDGFSVQNLPKGTTVYSPSWSTGTVSPKLVKTATDNNYYGAVDSSTFTPKTSGLYLFRRNIGETADGSENNYEYSGYYYDADKGCYFALYTVPSVNGNSDYVLPNGAVTATATNPSSDLVMPVTPTNVNLFTAKETVINSNQLTWAYNETDKKYTVSYTNNSKTIKIYINLAAANIGTDAEQWTEFKAADAAKTTFYYNNDVEAGATTTKLIDSLTLDGDDTVNGAYLAFDFDLNVFMESIQVTSDADGVEGYTSVTPWAASNENNVGVSKAEDNGTRTVESEIENITWTKAQ